MRAIVFENPDSPCVIKNLKTPQIQSHQVLIKLVSASLNRRDLWIKKGIYKDAHFPCIVGSDGAGIVEKIGSHVDKIWLNKEVIINPGLQWGGNPNYHSKQFNILGLPSQGTLADYIAIDQANIYTKPAQWTFAKASALPLAGLTAYRALFFRGQLQAGEKVLITGAGGGVATFLIKFAIAVGAHVYVTSSSEKKIRKAIKMGVQGGINYTQSDWHLQLHKVCADGFDLIVDSAAGPDFALLPGLLKIGGRIVLFGGTGGKISGLIAAHLFWKQASILGTTMGSCEDFEKMLHFVETHKIEPEVDQIFPMEDAELAFTYMEKQQQFGKIVINL